MPSPDYSVPPSHVYRTPDSSFDSIPDFPYSPRYNHFHGLRYAFIDETSGILHNGKELSPSELVNVPSGVIRCETYLCLHGQPTWSYLYRRMIPVFLTHSRTPEYIRRRILAPDFIGFGRSDKPVEDGFYTWDMHLDFLINFVRRHVIEEGPARGDVIGVVQDWGGILGLTLPPIFPNLFSHLLVMNTGLGLGKSPSKGWLEFHDFVQRNPDVKVGALVARGTKYLHPEEVAAYDAPYPDRRSKAGVRRFPPIVPREPHMPGVASSYAALAYFNRLQLSQLRVFVAIGLKDPVLGESVMEALIRTSFSTTGSFVYKHSEAGHFVQEWGSPIAQKALDAWSSPRGKEEDVKIEGVEWRAPKPQALSSHAKL